MAKINYVSKEESNYRMYGAPNGYFDDLYAEKQRRFMSTVSDASRDFFARVESVHSKWHGAEAVARGQRALAKIASNAYGEDTVRGLLTVEAIQTARHVMQEIILSHPEINRGVRRGKLAGYGMDLTKIDGELYTRVMDGVVVEDEEGNFDYTQVVRLEDDDQNPHFTHDQQMLILDTYDVALDAINKGIDVTTVWDGKVD